MSTMPRKKGQQGVALPYRRGYITDLSLVSAVADTLAEFSKLEVATDELARMFEEFDPDISGLLDEFRKEFDALKKEIEDLIASVEGGLLEDINKKLEEIQNNIDQMVKDKDELVNELTNILREDITDYTDKILVEYKKELDAQIKIINDSNLALALEVQGLKGRVEDMNTEISGIGADFDKKLDDAKAQLETDYTSKIKEGDDLVSSSVSALEKVVVDQNSAMSVRIDGLQSITNANTANITSLSETVTNNQESTTTQLNALESSYHAVNDTANQALDKAEEAAEIAINSTKYMKTFQIKAGPIADVNDTGVVELRESMVLGTGHVSWNLVVINRDTQASAGSYHWDLTGNPDPSVIEDMKTRIRFFDNNYLQFLYTYGHAGDSYLQLEDVLKELGSNGTIYKSLVEGGSYSLLGYRGVPQALEYLGTPDRGEGRIEVTVSMYRRNLVGLDGFTSSQFEELEKKIADAEAKFETQINMANAAIKEESKTRSDADGALAEQIQILEVQTNQNVAEIRDKTAANATAIEANTVRIESAEAEVKTAVASVKEMETTVANLEGSVATQLSEMKAAIDDNEALVTTEREARISADEGLARDISLLSVRVDNNEASITTLEQTIVTDTSALSQRIDNLTASVDSAAKAGVDNALNLDDHEKENYKSFANITSVQEVHTTEIEANAKVAQQLNTRLGLAEGSITEVKTSVATLEGSVNTSISDLTSKMGENTAKIGQVEKTVATNQEAAASRLNILEVRSNGDLSNIVTNPNFNPAFPKGFNGENSIVGSEIALVASGPAANALRVVSRDNYGETTAGHSLEIPVTEGDTFQVSFWYASDVAAPVGFKVGLALYNKSGAISWPTIGGNLPSKSWQKAEGTITVPAGFVRARAFLQMDYTAPYNKYCYVTGVVIQQSNTAKAANAAITEERVARVAADGALTKRIDTQQSEMNGIKSSVQVVSQTATGAQNAANSAQGTANTANGKADAAQNSANTANNNFTAMWGVKTQIGHVTAGFGLYQKGAKSAFVVDADQFVIMNRSGGGDSPFEVYNGIVRIKTANIDTAAITKLVADQIDVKNLNGATITSSTIRSTRLETVTLVSGSLNIGGKFIVDTAGNVTLGANNGATDSLRIYNNRIEVYGGGRLRVKIGQL